MLLGSKPWRLTWPTLKYLKILDAVTGVSLLLMASSSRNMTGWSEYSTLWVMPGFLYSSSRRSIAMLLAKPHSLSR
jgi:hypothetical protein